MLACGDLFEHNQVADNKIIARSPTFYRCTRGWIEFVRGNHDLPGPGSVWKRPALRAAGNLHVHDNAEVAEVAAKDGSTVRLHAFPVRSRYTLTDPLASAEVAADGVIAIGLAHGHLTTITFGAHEDEIRLPINPVHVDRIGLDYLALGHWHGTKLVSERIAYSGTPEQTKYAETDAGNVLLVSIADKGSRPVISPIRVRRFTWEHRLLTFAGDTDLGQLSDLLQPWRSRPSARDRSGRRDRRLALRGLSRSARGRSRKVCRPARSGCTTSLGPC